MNEKIEIKHPNIDLLKRSREDWGGDSSPFSIRLDWLRAVLPQLGLDVDKFIFREVVSSIIGDDWNLVGYTGDLQNWGQQEREYAKQTILTRMKEEIATGLLPKKVVGCLSRRIERIEGADWSDNETFEADVTFWSAMIGEVNNWAQKDARFIEAHDYYEEHSPEVRPYYAEFLCLIGYENRRLIDLSSD